MNLHLHCPILPRIPIQAIQAQSLHLSLGPEALGLSDESIQPAREARPHRYRAASFVRMAVGLDPLRSMISGETSRHGKTEGVFS